MKKIFSFVAAVAASMSMMAAVDFQYLPTAGDRFNTSDKVAVAADEVLAQGTNFTVKNAYATTYKAVGVLTDTAYAALQIGDVTVSYLDSRIQGQDNPTAGGANPVIEMKTPNAGACYKLDVTRDGYIYVAVKTTPNKQQFVFESVAEVNGVVGGSMVGYQYLMQANKANGTMCVEFTGDADNYLLAPPAMPYTYFTSSAFSTNGVGVLAFRVYAEASPYIFGTAGSKMMAVGVGFSETPVEVKAIGSKGIKALKPEWTGEDNYDDVVLTDKTASTYKTVNLSERPIFVKVALPANEVKSKYAAEDTTNIWAKVIVDKAATETTPATYKLNANIYAWVWGKDKEGADVDGKWLQAAKSGNYYVLQLDGYSEVGIVLNADGNWDGGNRHQTVDIAGVTSDICVRVGDVPADNQKCEVVMLDCLTGEPTTAVENVEAAMGEKFIGRDGQLYIRSNGHVYNVLGAVVE